MDNQEEQNCNLSFAFVDCDNEESDISCTSKDSGTVNLQIDVDYNPSSQMMENLKFEESNPENVIDEEIERQWEAKAAKTKLSTVNVKSILKHVISDEQVRMMMQKQLNNDEKSSITFEPKITRAKAKELAIPQLNIPPITTTSPAVQVLIEKEFNEDSSDEEYVPVDDHEDEEDEEKDVEFSMGSDIESEVVIQSVPESTQVENERYDKEGVFKIPNVPELKEPTSQKTLAEEEAIGQRTRSKLSLIETEVEEILKDFNPPDDLTKDMQIEEECLDYFNFLVSLSDDPAPEETKVDDDPEADPEYNFMQDAEVDLLDKEEFRADRGVKIPRKEVDDITKELRDFADKNMKKDQEVKRKKKANENANFLLDITNGGMLNLAPNSTSSEIPECMTELQKLLLAVQLQQHIQLLTQTFLMTYQHPEYYKKASGIKGNLESLKIFSTGENSMFNVEGLDESLLAVKSWETMLSEPDFFEEYKNFVEEEIKVEKMHKKSRLSYEPRFHPELKNLMLNCKALKFINLLPPFSFRVTTNNWKHIPYFPCEEHLMVLGLDDFLPYVSNKQKKFNKASDMLADAVMLINEHLLPPRKFIPLLRHIQRCQKGKNNPDNIVTRYFKTKIVPKVVHVIPENLKLTAPKEQMELLPELWKTSETELEKKRFKRDFFKDIIEADKLSRVKISRRHPLLNPVVNVLINVPGMDTMKISVSDNSAASASSSEPKENEAEKLPQLRQTTQRLAKIRSAENMKLMTQGSKSPSSESSSSRSKSRCESGLKTDDDSASSVKGDDEEEIAELMIACTTIKKDTTNRKKAKQARELENIKRLVEAENDANRDERLSKYAVSFLQKLHTVVEPNDPEIFRSVLGIYHDFCEKIECVESKNEETEQLVVDMYKEVCQKLKSYPELCSDFLLFLTPQQASKAGKSVEYEMLRKMKEFVEVAQVYFAKQPSRLAKIMQAIPNLANDPSITMESVTEQMSSVLKDHPVVLDLFLQILPNGKPPECLFASQLFENLQCPVGPHDKNKTYTEDAPELYESIELPGQSSHDDPYGGESCKCECHNCSDPSTKNTSEHCASCGTRFLNGRIYLQTPDGLRPAKITFPGEDEEQLENIARVSLKSQQENAKLAASKRRKRNPSKSESSLSPSKEPCPDEKSKRGISSPPKNEKIAPEAKKRKIENLSLLSPQAGTSKRQASPQQCSSVTILKSSKAKKKENLDSEASCSSPIPQEEDSSITIEEHNIKTEIKLESQENDVECSQSEELSTPSTSSSQPWSREEDYLILTSLRDEYQESTFTKIAKILKNRSHQSIRDRFRELHLLMQKYVTE